MRRQLKMDMLFQEFARSREDGDGSVVCWTHTISTFVEWPDGCTFPLTGKAERCDG
jgi:hypothetical protein